MKITLDEVVVGAEGSLVGQDPGLYGITTFEGCSLLFTTKIKKWNLPPLNFTSVHCTEMIEIIKIIATCIFLMFLLTRSSISLPLISNVRSSGSKICTIMRFWLQVVPLSAGILEQGTAWNWHQQSKARRHLIIKHCPRTETAQACRRGEGLRIYNR